MIPLHFPSKTTFVLCTPLSFSSQPSFPFYLHTERHSETTLFSLFSNSDKKRWKNINVKNSPYLSNQKHNLNKKRLPSLCLFCFSVKFVLKIRSLVRRDHKPSYSGSPIVTLRGWGRGGDNPFAFTQWWKHLWQLPPWIATKSITILCLSFLSVIRHYFFIWVILNVPFYDMPKRCLETFLYSLPKSSLLLALEIYHLVGKDHALTFSEALILPRDVWYMPSAGKVFFIPIMRGGHLHNDLSLILHMDSEIPCPGPHWRVTSFCFMIENEPAHWVCLVSMQPSGTTCQGVGRHVYHAFTASINWPQWVTSFPFARRYICRQSRLSDWVFMHLVRGQGL